jgi:hypothetical protein
VKGSKQNRQLASKWDLINSSLSLFSSSEENKNINNICVPFLNLLTYLLIK